MHSCTRTHTHLYMVLLLNYQVFRFIRSVIPSRADKFILTVFNVSQHQPSLAMPKWWKASQPAVQQYHYKPSREIEKTCYQTFHSKILSYFVRFQNIFCFKNIGNYAIMYSYFYMPAYFKSTCIERIYPPICSCKNNLLR